MDRERSERLQTLMTKGVEIRCPQSVYIGPEVDLQRLTAEGVVIHGGCRITGRETLLSDRVELGREAPVTLENCRLGPGVKLAGGYFNGAVFLEGATMQSGAHVRGGTILEEGARGAHSVALKQTILFPFVTLGSLINFCDCLMAGGTSASDHSEVGSSYIHFNYTPNQDKATPSLLGDVPHGVMLDQAPIFLGGQGGLVGPRRIAFGTVVAAGTICRRDELRPQRLIVGGGGRRQVSLPFDGAGFDRIAPTLTNNVVYIANLLALQQWYRCVRQLFIGRRLPERLHAGLVDNLHVIIDERIDRLSAFCRIMGSLDRKSGGGAAGGLAEKAEAVRNALQELRRKTMDMAPPSFFMEGVEKEIERQGRDYLRVVQSMDGKRKTAGTRWLQRIVDGVCSEMATVLPEVSGKGVGDG